MIIVYTSKGNTSCQNAIKWFKERRMLFQEHSITRENPLTVVELKELLKLTENGFEDLVSCRSLIYKQLAVDFQKCKTNEGIAYSNLLKKPVTSEGKKLVVGYNNLICQIKLDNMSLSMQLKNTSNGVR